MEKEIVDKGYPEISIKQIDQILHSINSIGNHHKALYLSKEEIDTMDLIYYGKDARKFYENYTSKRSMELTERF
ncbi:hypothetical protein ACI2OX_19595 [Bacillus sp. N9]